MKELLFGTLAVVVMYILAQTIVFPIAAEMNNALALAFSLIR